MDSTNTSVVLSQRDFASAMPCLPEAGCATTRFTLGTLPMRAFTGGHTYFMQRVQNFEGHQLPRLQVLTVHSSAHQPIIIPSSAHHHHPMYGCRC